MKKILIVEDVEMNRDLLVQLLEDRYQLIEAVNGAQGLVLASREQPDLVLLDISLPEMDGYEVARRLRADPALGHIPLIAVTAQLSDLTESLFKRNSGVKDSGSLLPGHGGLLDRFDSFLLTAPIYYYALVFLGKA